MALQCSGGWLAPLEGAITRGLPVFSSGQPASKLFSTVFSSDGAMLVPETTCQHYYLAINRKGERKKAAFIFFFLFSVSYINKWSKCKWETLTRQTHYWSPFGVWSGRAVLCWCSTTTATHHSQHYRQQQKKKKQGKSKLLTVLLTAVIHPPKWRSPVKVAMSWQALHNIS